MTPPATLDDGQLLRLWGVLRIVGWLAVPVLLSVPAVAMALDADGVEWTLIDFVFAGGVVVFAGVVLELVSLATRRPLVRFGAAFGVALVVGLIWAWAVA